MWWLVPCQSNIISIPLVTAFMVLMEQCYNLYLHIFASTALFTPLPMILKSPCYNFSVSHMFFYSFNGSMISVCHLVRQNRAEACTNDISARHTPIPYNNTYSTILFQRITDEYTHKQVYNM